MSSALKYAACAALALVVAGWFVWSRSTTAPLENSRAVEQAPLTEPGPAPAPLPPAPARSAVIARPAPVLRSVTADPGAPQEEKALMERLRELGPKDPELSLKLAREGNAKFSHSDDAPERTWFLVKALVDLRRFDEARAEARVMVDTYRDTPWALDVERHLLMHPSGPPPPASESEPATP